MGKNILVIAATHLEIQPFLRKSGQGGNVIKQYDVDVLISGIGLTATTYRIVSQLKLKSYDLVIQAGVAGCFDREADLGEVFVVSQDTIADQSVVELNTLKTLFDLQLLPYNQKPYDNGWLVNPYPDLIKTTGLKPVKGISVNEISTSEEKIGFYRDLFNPVTESMEGAALHYVCLMEQVPFLQLRSISNYIGERNRKKWDMKSSVNNLNDTMTHLIKKYFG